MLPPSGTSLDFVTLRRTIGGVSDSSPNVLDICSQMDENSDTMEQTETDVSG
jgi:hypothetical protein